MTALPRARFFSVASRVLAASLAGAVPAGIIDVGRAALRSNDPVAAGVLVHAAMASVALYGVFGLALGLVAGVVFGSVAGALPPASFARARARLSADDSADTSTAAALFASGATAVFLAAFVYVYARAFGLEMASKRNGALSIAMVAVAALPVAVLGAFPVYLLLRPAAALLPRPRALVALGAMASATALAVVAAVLSVDWRVIDFGPFVALATVGGLGAAHWFLWGRGRLGEWWRSLGPLVHRVALFAPVALVLVLMAATLGGLERDARALALVGEETSGARTLLRLARRAADRDHDGYAAILGGGDCNDRDATVHPGADDVPGNGVDEDCSDGDAPILSVAPAVAAPLAAPSTDAPPASHDVAAPHPAAGDHFDGNLLIITIDTLRADRLNAKTMPHLAALAKDAVVFNNAYAQAPNTPRSFPSFLTGRFPSQVHFTRGFANFSPLAPDNLTFFEELHRAGFHTVGEFSHFYLDPRFGVGQGFDEWDNADALTLHDSNTDISAPRIAAKVVKKLRELSKSKQRFVLWTHFFDPHSRYMEHAEFPVHGGGMQSLPAKYDGEVSFVDMHLQKILDALKSTGLDGKTAIVVFSDHGEGFGEHRFGGEQMFFHGQTLYDELLRVPLLFHVPGVAPRTVDEKVMLLDLAPTVLDLLGVPVPSQFEGRSLAPAVRGATLSPRPVYAELLPEPSWNHSWRVIVDGTAKLIYKISENSVELYDLAQDPEEKHNRAFEAPDDAKRLKQGLQRWMQAAATSASPK